jgi:hypothetical protein
MAITFGVHEGLQDCALDELRRVWRFVDRSGFDRLSVWITSTALPMNRLLF